jgi:hypothetical protein
MVFCHAHDQIATKSLEWQQIVFAEEIINFLNNLVLQGKDILSSYKWASGV